MLGAGRLRSAMCMNHSLRVLLIDDNPDDRLLALRALEKEIPGLKATEIINQAALDRVLGEGGFDLVVTDYQLFWSNGVEVLRKVKRLWPNVPVVMFTGTGSEEVAVEAMKAGLDDYVIKSPRHFARLPAAATNALRQSKMRMQKAEAEANFARLFETMPIGLFHMRPDGTILQVNGALATMLGFEHPTEASGTHALEFFMTAEEHETWRNNIERDGTVVGHETQIHRRDGSLLWVEISARALRDGISGTLFYEGSVEDISQRRAAQLEKERLIAELRGALSHAKQLSGLLPICSSCKKIRDDRGEWNPMEVYIQQRSDASFTHSFCPDCVRRLYPEIFAEATK
jgi:PAS domain S-box-containing protein